MVLVFSHNRNWWGTLCLQSSRLCLPQNANSQRLAIWQNHCDPQQVDSSISWNIKDSTWVQKLQPQWEVSPQKQILWCYRKHVFESCLKPSTRSLSQHLLWSIILYKIFLKLNATVTKMVYCTIHCSQTCSTRATDLGKDLDFKEAVTWLSIRRLDLKVIKGLFDLEVHLFLGATGQVFTSWFKLIPT